MAPPVRRRFDSDEELRRKIEALSIMGVPPRLDEPDLDAREALFELAKGRGPDVGTPYTGPLAEAPVERPAYVEYKRDDNEPEPALPPAAPPPPPAPPPPAPPSKPTLDELLKDLPALTVQKPVPPKPTFEQALRETPPPLPEPVPPPEQPIEAVPPQEMGPPAPEDVLASGRNPFDPRDPAAPQNIPHQEFGPPDLPPIPEDPEVMSAREALSDYNAEASDEAASAPRAPPLPGDAPADPTLRPGQAPPLAGRRDYSDTLGRVASTPQQGGSPDLYGHDDDGGFKRAEAIRQARAAYDRQSAQGGRHWEDEFLANNPRMGNQEFQRRSIALGLFGGYDRMREAQQDRDKQQQQYATGLAQARLRDQGERRISRAQAEAIAATGQVSPEAAAEMRLNDPLLKQFGQFASQGGRAEHLDYQRDKMINELLSKHALLEGRVDADLAQQKMRDEAALEREKLRGATQRGVAETYAKGRNRQLSPEEKFKIDAGLVFEGFRSEGMTPGIAREAVRGNYANVPPALLDRVQAEVERLGVYTGRDEMRSAALGPTVTRSKGDVTAEAAGKKARETNIEALDLYVKKNQQNPQFALDWQTDWDDKKGRINEAWQGWNAMKPESRAAFVQWAAKEVPGDIREMIVGPDQKHAAAVQTLINELVAQRSGKAVTDQEWGRIGSEVGLATGSYSPFKSTDVIEGYIKRAGKALGKNRKTYERVMGGWK